MRQVIRRYAPYLFALPLLLMIAGCGAMSNTVPTGTGIGADAGPWPASPNRTAANANGKPNADEVPNAPVVVVLRAKSAENEEIKIDVTGVQLKSGGTWYDVAKKTDIAAITAQPVRAGEKGTSALLAKGLVPKRKYTQFQLKLDDKNTLLLTKTDSRALTLKNTVFDLHDWTPDDKKKENVLVINLDGSKHSADSATLASDAVSVRTEDAAGSITGKLNPALPTARIEVFWSGSKVSFGYDTPAAQGGTFTLKDLPAGPYTLTFTVPGYRLVEPPKDAIIVAGKAVDLKELALTPETTTH